MQIFSFISVGNLLAPLLGGVLYEKTGYVGVFGLSVGLLGVDFLMRLLVIEKKVAKRYDAVDPKEDESDPETTPDAGQGDVESVKAPKDQEDLEPYRLSRDQPAIARKITLLPCLANTRLAVAFAVAFVQAMLLGNFDATVPTNAHELWGFGSLKSGLLFLPLGALDLVIGPVAGWFVDKYGTKPGAVVGYTYLVPVLILLRLPHEGGTDQVLLYGGLLALCGAGLAIIGAPSLVEAGTVVQKYYEANPDFFGEQGPYAQLYGLNSMVFSLGLCVGPALAGGLKECLGYGNMNIVLAAISGATAFVCFFWLGGPPRFMAGC